MTEATTRERRWWPGVIGVEPAGWPQRRARIGLLRLACAANPVVAVALLVLVVASAAIAVALQVAGGRLVGAIPAAVAAGEATKVRAALMLLASLYVANNIAPTMYSVVSTWLAQRVDHRIKLDLMGRMLAPVGISHLEDADIRDEVARASALQTFTPGGAIVGMAVILKTRLVSLGSVALVGLYQWWLAIALLLVALVTETAARRQYMATARIVYRQTQDLRRSDYYRTLMMGEGAKELRVFGLAAWMNDRFAEHWLDAMRVVWRERGLEDSYVKWATPLQIVANGGAYLLVGVAAVHHDITLARAVVLLAAIGGIRAFISFGLHRTYTEYGAMAYLPILDLDAKIAAHARGTEGVEPRPGHAYIETMPRSEIRFEDVSFRYPGRDNEVFSHLDLTIPAGRSLAIVGLNGAGKTTLCKLLARCYEPTSGRILVDGVPLTALDAHAWQRRIAAVFQDFVTFPLALRDNVGFGAVESMNDAMLRGAADKARCLDIIERAPAGWDSVLSKRFDNGIELSGGEAQRIALARALLAVDAGAGVLMLDEPTASLDVRGEAELFDRYLELTRGVTSILISHRFSTVRHADAICVLDSGRVVERGTHDSLVAAGGQYAEMFHLQASRYADDAVRKDGQ
jgi:ATP-binding cassette subfamily B protein